MMSVIKKRPRVKAVHQFHISLLDIEPLIWRRIQVPEAIKLPQMHRIIQLLFNWEDYHMHEFVAGRRIYSEPDPEDDWFGRKVMDERGVLVTRLAERIGDEFEYHYDFGDDWRHHVLLEGILLPEPEVLYPRCIAGARNGPPEDAGGSGGYADYLEALADPEHEEHEQMLAWRGPFDPEYFSLKAINSALHRAFYRRPKVVSPSSRSTGNNVDR